MYFKKLNSIRYISQTLPSLPKIKKFPMATKQIDLKRLYKAASDYIMDWPLIAEHPDVRLEQVEYKELKQCWEIVISFLIKNEQELNLLSGLQYNSKVKRTYKMLEVSHNYEINGSYIFNHN